MGRESRWLDEVEREYGWIGQMEMSDGVERWVDGIEDIYRSVYGVYRLDRWM